MLSLLPLTNIGVDIHLKLYFITFVVLTSITSMYIPLRFICKFWNVATPVLVSKITNVDDEFARASKIVSELATSTNEDAISIFLKLINSNTNLKTTFVDNLLTNKPLLKDLGALEYDDFKLFLKKVGIEDTVNIKKITNSLLTDPSILTQKKIFNWVYKEIKVGKNTITKNADDALVELLTDPNTKDQFNAITKKRNAQEFLDGLYNKIVKEKLF